MILSFPGMWGKWQSCCISARDICSCFTNRNLESPVWMTLLNAGSARQETFSSIRTKVLRRPPLPADIKTQSISAGSSENMLESPPAASGKSAEYRQNAGLSRRNIHFQASAAVKRPCPKCRIRCNSACRQAMFLPFKIHLRISSDPQSFYTSALPCPGQSRKTVSYTHLTLPTKLEV